MSKVQLQGNVSGTGIFTIASPNSNTDRTLTLPDNTGTVLTTGSTGVVTQTMLASNAGIGGPSFMALMTSGQSFPSTTNTVVQYNNEQFDSTSRYNPTGSTVGGIPAYSFLPNVAGWYFVQGNIVIDVFSNGGNEFILRLFKNGTDFIWGNNNQNATTHFNGFVHSSVVFLNGSTDYIQLSVYSQQTIAASVPSSSQFSSFLIRAT